MGRFIPLDGQRFAHVIVLSRNGVRDGQAAWLCRCDCGGVTTVRGRDLRCGNTKSCGCRKYAFKVSGLKHGLARGGMPRTREYRSWAGAKARCFQSNNPKFPQYGGRGITMCPEWRDSFPAFLRDMRECPAGLTLDRIDVNGHYEPSNCRWATVQQQNHNRRKALRIVCRGAQMNLDEASAAVGLSYGQLLVAVKKLPGATAEDIASRVRRRRVRYTDIGLRLPADTPAKL